MDITQIRQLIMTTSEVCAEKRCRRDAVKAATDAGHLHTTNVGQSPVFLRSEVARWDPPPRRELLVDKLDKAASAPHYKAAVRLLNQARRDALTALKQTRDRDRAADLLGITVEAISARVACAINDIYRISAVIAEESSTRQASANGASRHAVAAR